MVSLRSQKRIFSSVCHWKVLSKTLPLVIDKVVRVLLGGDDFLRADCNVEEVLKHQVQTVKTNFLLFAK